MPASEPHAQGARTWFFPDGYIPAESKEGSLPAHEALMLFNTGPQPAHVELDVYFEDRDPVKGIPVEVGAERVRMLRMDDPGALGGLAISRLTQYALRVRSDQKIIAQFGRLDATQPNLAYYCVMGYPED